MLVLLDRMTKSNVYVKHHGDGIMHRSESIFVENVLLYKLHLTMLNVVKINRAQL